MHQVNHASINSALSELQRLGIVHEVTGRKRGRVYSYRAFMDILSEGVGLAPEGKAILV